MRVTKGTVIRTILLIIALINMFLRAKGINIINVSESDLYVALEYIIEVAIIIVAWWKNNSVTQKAIKADEFLKELKNS